jgi:hypothetical protein
MQTAQQKAALMQSQHAMKQQDMAARQGERQEAMRMRQMTQRPPGAI